ncbi:uncharacterized protein TNCV_1322111 [Trichonephila clavipes]|nr:uncharacterized protein TNCV_1322111 [Trichonephila clavipes]
MSQPYTCFIISLVPVAIFPKQTQKLISVNRSTNAIFFNRLQLNTSASKIKRAVGNLVVRASDSGTESLGSMPVPPNALRVHTEYVLVKSVNPKVSWAESRMQGTVEYFPPLQFHGKIVEVEIGGVAIYRPFGNFTELNGTVICMVAKVNDRHTSGPLPR